MSRSVFDLPLRLRRTYFAALQLLDELTSSGAASDVGVPDVDISQVTRQHVAETRRHLLQLADDLLSVGQDGEHVTVFAAQRLVSSSFRFDAGR